MKCQINCRKLLNLLTKATKIIQPKSPIPIYSMGLFEVKDNKLSITVTDMDHTLVTHMEVEGDDCSFILKVQDLFEIVRKLTGKITIYRDRNRIRMETEHSKIELILVEDEFPKVHMDSVNHITQVESKDFTQLFGFLPITNEEWSFVFQVNNNHLEAIASDRKRLIFSQIPSTSINSNQFPLSFKTLTLLTKYTSGLLDIYHQQSQLIFKFEDGILWSRFSSVPPINHTRILLKKQQAFTILCNRTNLLNSLNIVSSLASNISHTVKLLFENNTLTLCTSDAARGQAEEVLTVEGSTSGFIATHCEFLINAIKTIKSDNVLLHYTGPISHFFIASDSTVNAMTHVIMPIVVSQ